MWLRASSRPQRGSLRFRRPRLRSGGPSSGPLTSNRNDSARLDEDVSAVTTPAESESISRVTLDAESWGELWDRAVRCQNCEAKQGAFATMSHLIRRRTLVTGCVASIALIRHAGATPPATIADGTPIGRGKLLVVHENASGRIVAFDSSSYLDPHPTGPTDVIVVGSYCGTRILAPMFTRGVKAVIATDAGIGKDEAGISGLKRGERIGVPVAVIAAMSAETSNGRSTLLGEISRANAQARALGVTPGMVAYEAAVRLAKAAAGVAIPTPLGAEEAPVVVEETPQGRIWATPGTTAIKDKVPNDVICS